MSGVQGDPEVLEAFARSLEQYVTETLEKTNMLRGRLSEMESSGNWADDQYRAFAEMFYTTSIQLEATLTPVLEEQVQFLLGLAQRLRDYQEQH